MLLGDWFLFKQRSVLWDQRILCINRWLVWAVNKETKWPVPRSNTAVYKEVLNWRIHSVFYWYMQYQEGAAVVWKKKKENIFFHQLISPSSATGYVNEHEAHLVFCFLSLIGWAFPTVCVIVTATLAFKKTQPCKKYNSGEYCSVLQSSLPHTVVSVTGSYTAYRLSLCVCVCVTRRGCFCSISVTI